MRAASVTDIGRNRDMNQDFVFVSEKEIGGLPNLFIVADGMGGHNAGEYASQRAVEVIVSSILKSHKKGFPTLMTNAINEANKTLLDAARNDERMKGMGTTIVATTYSNKKAYVANVGDSRMYLITGDEARQITEDHSLVEEMIKKGEINKKDANIHPSRNIITRAVGVQQSVSADFFEVDVRNGEMLLLCSDGLTNMLGVSRMRSILLNEVLTLEQKAETLVENANRNGGEDNISVILIDPFASEVNKC